MGLDKQPERKDNWTEFLPQCTPWYPEIMSRERFQIIYHAVLHASEVGAELEKIEPFLNKLTEKFHGASCPCEDLTIDEMVIGHKMKTQTVQCSKAQEISENIWFV